MPDIFWENKDWTAWYTTIDTPFGPLTRLVPGSLTRKAHTQSPEDRAPAPADSPVARPASRGPARPAQAD